MSHGTCYGLKEVVVGADPFDYEQIWNDMWAKTYYYGRSGLTEAKKIASMAADNNIMVVPHAFKTGILVAASIHLIASMPHVPFLEFSVTESAIRKELLVKPFVQKDGFVEVSATPGLGIELNPEVIRKFGVNIN